MLIRHPFCLDLPAGFRAAQRKLSVARTYVCDIRRRALVELYDAGGRSQERNGISPGLSGFETAFTVVQWIMVGPLTALAFARAPQRATVTA